MNRLSRLPIVLLAAVAILTLPGCDAVRGLLRNDSEAASSVLRVESTQQFCDPRRPWLNKSPVNREGLGVLLEGKGGEGGLVLVSADMADHAASIQLQSPDKTIRCQASVVAVDPESDLALVRPSDPAILRGRHPLPLEPSLPAGTTLRILQLEPDGAPALSGALITTATVSPYPSGASYLLYRITTTIPQREGSFVVPALHEGGLAGLVMRYDPRTQSAEIIPSPLIARFVREGLRPGFRGLARAGITWAPIRGETLRGWLGLPKDSGGVAVISLDRNGPAFQAGLRKGDILTSLDGRAIGPEGDYGHPVFGKLNFSNIVSLEHSPGDTVTVGYLRPDGKGHCTKEECRMRLTALDPASEISPSLPSGDRDAYLFYGGLLMRELSRPYLREWGNNWPSEAPRNLVSLDLFQDEEAGERKHFVILSAILPSEQTLGCENLAQHLVERVNGRPIRSLGDVAEARKHPEGGFHRIDLEGSSGPIFLDAATLDFEEARLKAEYGIPDAVSP